MNSRQMNTIKASSYPTKRHNPASTCLKQASSPSITGHRRRLQVQAAEHCYDITNTRKEIETVFSKTHHSSASASTQREQNKQHQRTQIRSKHNGKKGDANWRNWREVVEGEPTANLNWQQISLLKSKRVNKEADLPAWAPPTFATSAKGGKKKSKTGQSSSELLPPLRFSSANGKSAWRFVLPSPNPPHSNDLPNWCDGKADNLVVTLGSRGSTSVTSSPPLTPNSSKQDMLFDSDSSLSHDSSLASIEFQGEPNKASTNGLVSSMLETFSIYAGPRFSAAPEPCSLPFPSFLSRS